MRLFNRWRFVKEHPGWTYDDYDAAAWSDILLDAEFEHVNAALVERDRQRAEKEAAASG